MSRVEFIEDEVKHLSREEFFAFREWFINFDMETWDKKIEHDARNGKLDELASKAIAAHKRGESREI